jgi:hypothetical protein
MTFSAQASQGAAGSRRQRRGSSGTSTAPHPVWATPRGARAEQFADRRAAQRDSVDL